MHGSCTARFILQKRSHVCYVREATWTMDGIRKNRIHTELLAPKGT